jgi:hypothetical protein
MLTARPRAYQIDIEKPGVGLASNAGFFYAQTFAYSATSLAAASSVDTQTAILFSKTEAACWLQANWPWTACCLPSR